MMMSSGLLQCSGVLIIVLVAQITLGTACSEVFNVEASLKPGWKYIVESPGFPNSYPANTTCIWNITAPDNYQLVFIYEHFQLEPSKECENDYLHISFTNKSLHIQIWKKCSILADNFIQSLPLTHRIRRVFSKQMWIKFITDGSIEYKGFKGEVRLVAPNYREESCRNYLNDTRGSLASPKYPSPYRSDLSCIWHIAVPGGRKVKLKFINIDLENTKNNKGDCAHDYVEIHEGVWGEYGIILGRFCGDTIPEDVTSPSNQMWVQFVSNNDPNNKHQGFEAEFTAYVSSSSLLMSYTSICLGALLVISGF